MTNRWAACGALVFALACADQTDTNKKVQTITAEDIAALGDDERMTIDLTAEHAYKFDQTSGAIAFNKLDLICPNGQQMGLETWIQSIFRERGIEPNELVDPFTVSGNGDADNCLGDWCDCDSCFWCPDGALMCIGCPGDAQDRLLIDHDSDWYSRHWNLPTTPGDPKDPQDPGDPGDGDDNPAPGGDPGGEPGGGGGGSGGGGSGGGGSSGGGSSGGGSGGGGNPGGGTGGSPVGGGGSSGGW